MIAARESLHEIETRGGDAGLIMARHQSDGRGRQGRAWHGTEGAFLGTFIFRCPLGETNLSGYSLAAGLMVADALYKLGAPVLLKWPNDLVSSDQHRRTAQKVGGILIDVIEQGGRKWILFGLGLNLHESPAEVPNTTCLGKLCDRLPSYHGFIDFLAPPLLAGHDHFCRRGGLVAFKTLWDRYSFFSGHSVTVDTGSEHVTGHYKGISEDGSLMLGNDNETRKLYSGHVLSWASI